MLNMIAAVMCMISMVLFAVKGNTAMVAMNGFFVIANILFAYLNKE